MALIKAITLNNGIVINYHRIVSVNNITNQASIIEVAGYTSKVKRDEEKEALKNNQPMDIYIDTTSEVIPYEQKLDVDAAYEYLKTLEKYSNAEND